MSEQTSDDAKAAWNVKDFSVKLRQQITDRASREGVTVAQWLAAFFAAHGFEAPEIQVNLSEVKRRAAEVGPAPTNGHGSISDVTKLVDAACRFAEHREHMPRELKGAVSKVLRDQLAPFMPPPRQRTLPLLSAPNGVPRETKGEPAGEP